MQYGICHLSIVPVRVSPDDTSEMLTQLLYGDLFKVKDTRKYWVRIEIIFDGQEGWISKKQFQLITETDFKELNIEKNQELSTDFISNIIIRKNVLQPITIGSRIDVSNFLGHEHDGSSKYPIEDKSNLVNTALVFLNAPYLWGGKTPFGVDCSGFTQMVYKLNGYKLYRTTEKQATQGEVLSFIEESEPGDLVFFDNTDGLIDHVGIILKDNYIIHAHGCVRIDRIDHTGIFNTEEKIYSHKLRVIKKII
ncbi:C40 family peptidase [Croceitalea sp. MTPC9]|uniref:C40 family peptidase n=1 Tax=unclassified Croceitalea TaxID=2632280 RepID=UPI002B3AF69C|nr:C40 family peptidase [Croceitalea sp. MTPC6]GMN16224.1 C40 family peptidase [Croceitalea sp. MTPC9]